MNLQKFQNGFFDRLAVTSAMEAATRKALSKGGAFIRQTAKSSLRYRKKASMPGQPPSVHRDDRPGGLTASKGRAVSILKEFIFFAWDASSRSVVIGPAGTNQVAFTFTRQGKPTRGTVPGVLESGGSISVLEVFRAGQWQRADLRSRRRLTGLPQRMRTVRIEKRPFMFPAMVKESAHLAGAFRSSVIVNGSGLPHVA